MRWAACPKRGEALTADALCAKYHELNKLYFGPDMISDDGIALEWARIPHFFYNYYVFQYATGFSAAVAIANRILAEGAPRSRTTRSSSPAAASIDPISLLKIAGVDMSARPPSTPLSSSSASLSTRWKLSLTERYNKNHRHHDKNVMPVVFHSVTGRLHWPPVQI